MGPVEMRANFHMPLAARGLWKSLDAYTISKAALNTLKQMAVILQATFCDVFAHGKMYFNRISQQFLPGCQVDNESALAQEMAWRDKFLPEPTLTQFTDEYRASVCVDYQLIEGEWRIYASVK